MFLVYYFFIDPEKNAIGITLTQQMPGGDNIASPFQNYAYKALD